MSIEEPANRPDPSAMPGSAVDLAKLRERVAELLDDAVTSGTLVSIGAQFHGEPAAPIADDSGFVHEGSGEQLVEVTSAQLDALNEAHDVLADALASLDTGRK